MIVRIKVSNKNGQKRYIEETIGRFLLVFAEQMRLRDVPLEVEVVHDV